MIGGLRTEERVNLLSIGLMSAIAVGAQVLAVGEGHGRETEFLNENQAAMSKMMAAMTVKPSGDVDRDFAAAMIPHHQGAVEMAEAELRHGRNEQLRRLAQEIIISQTQEIAVMRSALEQSSSIPAA